VRRWGPCDGGGLVCGGAGISYPPINAIKKRPADERRRGVASPRRRKVACVPKDDKRASPSAGFTPFGESQCCYRPASKGVRDATLYDPGGGDVTDSRLRCSAYIIYGDVERPSRYVRTSGACSIGARWSPRSCRHEGTRAPTGVARPRRRGVNRKCPAPPVWATPGRDDRSDRGSVDRALPIRLPARGWDRLQRFRHRRPLRTA